MMWCITHEVWMRDQDPVWDNCVIVTKEPPDGKETL